MRKGSITILEVIKEDGDGSHTESIFCVHADNGDKGGEKGVNQVYCHVARQLISLL